MDDLQSEPPPSRIRSNFPGQPPGEKPIQERLFDALSTAKVLTSQVAMHLDRDWRTKLFHQLDSLHDVNEWEEGDFPVRQDSFATFLKVMVTLDPPRRPGLGLSAFGNLIAAWTTGKDRLTIEFLPADRVRWVLSMHYEDGPARYAGDIPVTHLREGLAKHNLEHWFAYDKETR